MCGEEESNSVNRAEVEPSYLFRFKPKGIFTSCHIEGIGEGIITLLHHGSLEAGLTAKACALSQEICFETVTRTCLCMTNKNRPSVASNLPNLRKKKKKTALRYGHESSMVAC